MEELPVPAAERTIRLIELLLHNPAGLTPQELLAQLDLSRSSLFDLLRTLKALGYVEQGQNRGRYLTGPRLQAWRRSGAGDSQEMLKAFYGEAHQSSLDETLALVIPAAGGMLVLAQVESSRQVRSVLQNGQLLADTSPAARLFEQPAPPEVQAQGYAYAVSDETAELALPVCADGAAPDASLLISAPAYRFNEGAAANLLPELREIAARLSYRLGAQVYAPFQSQEQAPIEATAPLTEAEMRRFLAGPWAARLACLRPDGAPHVVPVWQEWDGKAFYVAAWQGSRWGDYLRINPRLSLTVDEPWPPLRRVSAQGNAEALDPDQLPGSLESLLDRLSRRYLGEPLQPGLRQRTGTIFRIQPEWMRGWKGLQTAG